MSDILEQVFNIVASESEGSITMKGVTLTWDKNTPSSTITMMEFGEEKTYWCVDIWSGFESFIEEVMAA